MKLIVGLGNPGKEYEHTRHNIGFMFLDWWQEKNAYSPWQAQKKLRVLMSKNSDSLLAKPQTYMNLSGQPVVELVKYYRAEVDKELTVVFDDLDLEIGKWKIQKGRGPHGHNGLESIYTCLGTKSFTHIRVGVDGRAGARTCPPHNYVLQRFSPSDLDKIKTVFEEVGAKI